MAKIKNQDVIQHVFDTNSIIPVVIIDKESSVRKLTEVFLSNGIQTMEITLRTPTALKAIEIVAKEYPEIQIGAGTILCINDIKNCLNAGAKYLVSPTGQSHIVDYATNHCSPLLPAASTVTEAHNLVAKGFKLQKFFPAILAGGVSMLKTIGSVLPEVHFCPTGGIKLSNMNEFLALSNVDSVGASFLCSQYDIKDENWEKINNNCKKATATVQENTK